MKPFFSIKNTLYFALLLGIIAPMLILAIYTNNSHKEKFYNEFSHFRKDTTRNISKAMQDPLYYFSPNNASLVLEVIKLDRKISKIEVYDILSETHFIIMDFPDRKNGTRFLNQADIVRDGEKLGWLKIEFNDYQLRETLNEQKVIFINLCIITILASISILAPILYFKILSPLKQLLLQSKEFENNEFETVYTWNKSDEINLLGQSFEKARLSILELIGKLKYKNSELEKLYATDQLTSLFNRYKLNEVLEKEVILKHKNPDYQFGIILLDLDHFKRVNDVFGHPVGDTVLKSISAILKDSLRASDIAGRWGGEEFMLIIPQARPELLEQLAQRIRASIESHSFNEIDSITASFGTTLYLDAENIQTCIVRADNALYQAKEEGRNRVIHL